MPSRKPRTPSYRLHKPSGQAVVTLDGRDFYVGKHGSSASHAEYDRLVAEWLAAGRRVPPRPPETPSASAPLTVSELMLAYVRHADSYYLKAGRPTSEAKLVRLALRPVRRLYGHVPASDFGPQALKAVRDEMIRAGLVRTSINRHVGRILRMVRWAVAEEMIPPAILQALEAVPGLRRGRSPAREAEGVRPAPEADVEAVRPHVSRQVWAMIGLQRLTGMRPGEVCRMRTADIDRAGRIWTYTPADHKTSHHGKGRTIYLGPRAQEALRPWLRADPMAPLFQPREADAERQAARRAVRRSPVPPSQRGRRKGTARRRPGDSYLPTSYAHAVAAACRKAGVSHWHPNRLRHGVATGLRREFGLDVARVILGHSSTATTEVYAEVDRDKALWVMERIG